LGADPCPMRYEL